MKSRKTRRDSSPPADVDKIAWALMIEDMANGTVPLINRFEDAPREMRAQYLHRSLVIRSERTQEPR